MASARAFKSLSIPDDDDLPSKRARQKLNVIGGGSALFWELRYLYFSLWKHKQAEGDPVEGGEYTAIKRLSSTNGGPSPGAGPAPILFKCGRL